MAQRFQRPRNASMSSKDSGDENYVSANVGHDLKAKQFGGIAE